MLTGDNQGAASAVGRMLGLPEECVLAQLMPEDKLRLVERYEREETQGRRSGAVMMCGDGINDAPALAAAGVGVAMGAAGTAVAMETADVALMDSDLRKLVFCVDLGRRTKQTIRHNIALAFLSKLAMIVVTLMGLATLWMAIATDIGAMLLVTMNGMRLLEREPAKCVAKTAAAASGGPEEEQAEEGHLLVGKSKQFAAGRCVEIHQLQIVLAAVLGGPLGKVSGNNNDLRVMKCDECNSPLEGARWSCSSCPAEICLDCKPAASA